MSNRVKQINDNQFEGEVSQSKGLVLVDFSATWCAPCKRQLPILESFADNNEVVKVCTMDIDDAANTAAKLGIRSVPTLIMFQDGQPINTKIGLSTNAELNLMMVKKS